MISIRILASIYLLFPALSLAAEQINVTVFYESLCPDSQRFINKQLAPAYYSPLALYMNLMFVPYGNAKVNATGGIDCQHGPVECYGNRVQACAISKVSNKDNVVKFIDCLMQMAYDNKPANNSQYEAYIKDCASKHSLSDYTSQIEACANSTEADPLIAMYGNLTMNFQPPIKGVPTTAFNGKSSKDINDNAQKDFVKTLCGYISGTKPAECKGNSAVDVASSAFLVVSALILSRYY